IYYRQQLIASHVRQSRPGMTTDAGHMPERHNKQQRWTPQRLKRWAATIGPNTATWVAARLHERDHPEQAYRVCLGVLNLTRQYPVQRLEASCGIANAGGLTRLKQIQAILKNNRDRLAPTEQADDTRPQHHAHIRGPEVFH